MVSEWGGPVARRTAIEKRSLLNAFAQEVGISKESLEIDTYEDQKSNFLLRQTFPRRQVSTPLPESPQIMVEKGTCTHTLPLPLPSF